MTDVPETDDALDDPWHDQLSEVSDEYGAPEVQALVAFVLGVATLWGFGLLNGSTFLFQYVAGEPQKTRLVLAAALGALFALAPIWLGWRAAARTLESDPRWVGTLARAAVLLGVIALVLRLVIAVIVAGSSEPVPLGRF
jgi:uncharacterized membrane protein